MKYLLLLLLFVGVYSCSSDESMMEDETEDVAEDIAEDSEELEEEEGGFPFQVSVLMDAINNDVQNNSFYVVDCDKGALEASAARNISQDLGLLPDTRFIPRNTLNAKLYFRRQLQIGNLEDWELTTYDLRTSSGSTISTDGILPEIDLVYQPSLQFHLAWNTEKIFGLYSSFQQGTGDKIVFYDLQQQMLSEIVYPSEADFVAVGQRQGLWVNEKYLFVLYSVIGSMGLENDKLIVYDLETMEIVFEIEEGNGIIPMVDEQEILYINNHLLGNSEGFRLFEIASGNLIGESPDRDFIPNFGPGNLGRTSFQDGKLVGANTFGPEIYNLNNNERLNWDVEEAELFLPVVGYQVYDWVTDIRSETIAIAYEDRSLEAYFLSYMDFDGNILFTVELPYQPEQVIKHN